MNKGADGMITTGANPKQAIIMSELKNNFGKSVSNGIFSAAGKVFFPTGTQMEKAVQKGYYNIIQSMVSSQCYKDQK
ncbi:hypothetical protein DS742_08595 [Lacrimispora amygdalina]|uniref:Uncharacterized protein n=2 Tax=Lacrimispora amygdalina TaxID=253257 RepID=A0A3E2NE61_9FIRM|nr:hypothetical protein DS742_08595 [Clostridium indicum]